MTSIICKRKCPKCKTYYLYDPYCNAGGDYYNTIFGFVLQAFCPVCGDMIPPIEIKDIDYISNNMLIRFSRTLALQHNLRFTETAKVAKKLHGFTDVKTAIMVFSSEFKIPIDLVQQSYMEFLG